MKENQIEDCDLNLESINLLNIIAALKFIYSTNQGRKRQKKNIHKLSWFFLNTCLDSQEDNRVRNVSELIKASMSLWYCFYFINFLDWHTQGWVSFLI